MSEATWNPSSPLRIGTRGSRLARWQAEWVAARLAEAHPDLRTELVEVRTEGDRDRASPLAAIGGTGLFTKEIQRALLDGRVDVAVHSLKDLPTAGPPELIVAAVPTRESVSDALIAPRHRTLAALPAGSRVGTSSLRRRAMLMNARPDLHVEAVRGNVETRLALALDGTLEAVVLADAGLRRLGLEAHATEHLAPPEFLPAVGQGALGIECRAADPAVLAHLAALDDPESHAAIRAERSLLAALQGGCLVPLGAWGRHEGGRLRLDAAVYDADGRHALRAGADRIEGEDSEGLGRRVASDLIARGARDLIVPPA